MTTTVDAVVVGGGHNGIVAANVLADRGWDVLVLEAAPQPGGAVRSGELTVPGYEHDWFSGFYPLGFASPVIARLHLEDHGLVWRRSPLVLANPTPDGPTAVISMDLDETAASLERFGPGDGDGWRRLYDRWLRLDPQLVRALMQPFPPVRPAMRLAGRLLADGGFKEILRFARFAVLPVRRMGEEHFGGEGGTLLLAGNALHADLVPESSVSGVYGWLLAMLGQQVGFPVPEGGAGRLIDAMVRRLRRAGGDLRCATPVEAVEVSGGRAVGVRTAGGERIAARRAVIADVDAPTLYRELVGEDKLPPSFVGDLRHFQWDTATVKVDWALRAPVPWSDPDCRRAATIHLTEGIDHLSDVAHALAVREVPARPFCVVGQYSMADPTRMPPGGETAWAYAHVPQRPRRDAGGEGITGDWEGGDAERFADRVEAEIERCAPGFRQLIAGRHVFSPPTMQAADPNLVGGAIAGGTAQLHQELVFRPVPGLARTETPIAGLYLGSSSAHPGGGVHGAPGHSAARAALLHDVFRRRPTRRAPG